MRNTRQDWWNIIGAVRGFEGEEGDGTEGGNEEGSEGTEEEEGEGSEEQETFTAEDVKGLKSALAKERADRKALDKELKTFRQAKQEKDDADKSEVERLTEAHTKSSAKVEKLAAGFRNRAVNDAILAAARDAKFRDPSDALTEAVREAIEVEQDEDDPTDISVDAASVVKAVKALAAKKPHWLAGDEEEGQQKQRKLPKSGSSFGGGSQKKTGGAEAERKRLEAMYPALQNR